jgi:hypothetical protein
MVWTTRKLELVALRDSRVGDDGHPAAVVVVVIGRDLKKGSTIPNLFVKDYFSGIGNLLTFL